MRMFYGTIGKYCTCQLSKPRILLLHMFIRCLVLNHISEIRWIFKIISFNTNLLLNFNEVSSILVRKLQFWYKNIHYSEIYLKKLQ